MRASVTTCDDCGHPLTDGACPYCDEPTRCVEVNGELYAIEGEAGDEWCGEQCEACGSDTFAVGELGVRCVSCGAHYPYRREAARKVVFS